MQTPDIIFLFRASSSGKTTLSKALQHELEAAYLHISLDAFGSMFPESKLGDQELCSSAAPKLFEGSYRSIAALASCGNKVIVDTIAHEHGPQVFKPLFEPFSVVYVAVRCPIEELERREMMRGDRVIGLARSQFQEVDNFLRYDHDIEIDTHEHNAQESAAIIKQFITF